MSEDISTQISPSLHPDNVRSIEGYGDDVAVFLGPTEVAFNVAYTGIQEVWNARTLAERNEAWTPEARVIHVDNYAQKHMERITREFDKVSGNLGKTIASLEKDLNTPIESRTGNQVASEVRAHCKALATGERIGFVQRAINGGDETTITALLGAPAYLSGLTPDLQATYTKLYREKNSPEVAKRLRVLNAAKEMLDNRCGLVFIELDKAVGCDPRKLKRLRAANSAAEKALIMSEK